MICALLFLKLSQRSINVRSLLTSLSNGLRKGFALLSQTIPGHIHNLAAFLRTFRVISYIQPISSSLCLLKMNSKWIVTSSQWTISWRSIFAFDYLRWILALIVATQSLILKLLLAPVTQKEGFHSLISSDSRMSRRAHVTLSIPTTTSLSRGANSFV
jgi:hypothetical protein